MALSMLNDFSCLLLYPEVMYNWSVSLCPIHGPFPKLQPSLENRQTKNSKPFLIFPSYSLHTTKLRKMCHS
jgi:hypothetical protein